MLPCTVAWFSSGVPFSRSLDANFGRLDRRIMIENRRPSSMREPMGFGPYGSYFWPLRSFVAETIVHDPTTSLAICAAASSRGKVTPAMSAEGPIALRVRWFMAFLLSQPGVYRLVHGGNIRRL